MIRKVPYAILSVMMLMLLSATMASAVDFGDYENQAILELDASLLGNNNAVTLLCRWDINDAAKEQSNLTVNIIIDGVIVGRNVSADAYPLRGNAWELTNAEDRFEAGWSHTVEVELVNPGEKYGSTGADNNKARILAPSDEWYSSIVDGFGRIVSTVESGTDQVPFLSDLPVIGSYLPMIIVLIIIIIVIWYLLKRRRKNKIAAQRPAVYRPPVYEPPQVQYYRNRRY